MALKKRAPEAHVNHNTFDIPARAVGDNTPKKAGGPLSTSKVWTTVKRLKGKDTRSQQLLLSGYTHICTYALDPDEETGAAQHCHEPLLLTRPGGTWIQTVAQRHLEQWHPDDPAAVESAERQDGRAKAKLVQQLQFDNPASKKTTSSLGQYKLTKAQEELSSQAAWYVYARMHVSKNSFADPYWKSMMRKAGASCLPCSPGTSSRSGCRQSTQCLSSSCASCWHSKSDRPKLTSSLSFFTMVAHFPATRNIRLWPSSLFYPTGTATS